MLSWASKASLIFAFVTNLNLHQFRHVLTRVQGCTRKRILCNLITHAGAMESSMASALTGGKDRSHSGDT